MVDSVVDAAVGHRAELLVARRTSVSRDLLPVAAPRDLDLDRVDRVVAAVGGGPHSELAAVVAASIGEGLDVEAQMVCAYAEPGDRATAEATVALIADLVPPMAHQVIQADLVADLLEEHGPSTLFVLGAPGGSFLQRLFFGPGARLIARAEVGAVVVRTAPTRVFQRMDEPVWISRHLPAVEALRLHPGTDPIPVVDDGVVVGLARREALGEAGSAPVETVMIEPVVIDADDLMMEAARAADQVGGAVPVVHDDRLVGLLEPAPVGS